MRITEELLRKHLLGLCTEEEKKAIKEWFERRENQSTGLKIVEVSDSERKEIWSTIHETIPELQPFNSSTKTIPLVKKLTRYAAAACIIFAAFFGGRFSANTANASEVVNKSPEDHLYIFGGSGTEGNLPGESC